jgi:transketolase
MVNNKKTNLKPEELIVLDQRSKYLRRLVVEALAGGKRGHIGSSFSLIEILRVLYDDILKVRPKDPKWPERDRCILSKGHGCLALYALLVDKGFFPDTELAKFCRPGAMLGGHPEFPKIPGVEFSTGALGHGLSVGIGMAISARIQERGSRVFVIMGDGEINEGSVWEAALSAGKHGLENLIILIDCNKMQSYGSTDCVLSLDPIADKWQSFGFSVIEVNGHCIGDLRNALKKIPLETKKPTAVICHTVKGKGVPFVEGKPEWHHKSNISVDVIQSLNHALKGS